MPAFDCAEFGIEAEKLFALDFEAASHSRGIGATGWSLAC